MASIINASSSGSGGIVQTADASGVLQLQANGTVALTVNSNASLTASNTGSGMTFASSAGSGLRIYGAAGTNQWDMYLNGSNLRYSDNTGGGRIVIDGTASVGTTFGVGGATPAASGAGVTFPATQSASSDANTLDDYEEGTWTPAFSPTGGGSISISVASARYVKIGQSVTITAYINVTSVSSPSGRLGMTGLPFSATNNPCAGVFLPNAFTSFTGYTGMLVESSATANLDRYGPTGINADMAGYVKAGSTIFLSATYFV